MNPVYCEVFSQQLASTRIRFESSNDSSRKQAFIMNRANADIGATVENDRILLIATKVIPTLHDNYIESGEQ